MEKADVPTVAAALAALLVSADGEITSVEKDLACTRRICWVQKITPCKSFCSIFGIFEVQNEGAALTTGGSVQTRECLHSRHITQFLIYIHGM